MKSTRTVLVIAFALLALVSVSCLSTRPLQHNECMLVRNNVNVLDEHNSELDNLSSYVRPIPNKKFMEVFNLKTTLYGLGTPRLKGDSVKDTKFKKWLRTRAGEAPVLLDSTEIENSLSQLLIVLSQKGYFDAEVSYNVLYKKVNPQMAKVNYTVTAHEGYTISHINYAIEVPEYRKILVLHKKEAKIKEGMQYNETAISNEITRMIDLIRNEGYYHVDKSLIKCEVSFDESQDTSDVELKTVSLQFLIRQPADDNSRYLYKYYINDVFVQPNFDAAVALLAPKDTMLYPMRTKRDSSNYYFITPRNVENVDVKPDFHYKVLANAIFTKQGTAYTQLAKKASSQALVQLDNFDFINIQYVENERFLDTINKIGYLDVNYRLSRKKLHSVGGQIDLRSDKSSLSFTYKNRNIFKGAEQLSINLSGGYFYYSLSDLFKKDKSYAYPEFGVSAALDFPKLFLFSRHQKPESVRHTTTLNVGVNYSGLYRRMMYNANIMYNWSPSYYVNHSLSPIDVSTVNISDQQYANALNYSDYPSSYQEKFNKYLLLALKYNFDYLVPFSLDKRDHNMRVSVKFESSGLLLKGLNALFAPDKRWVLCKNKLDEEGYDYSVYEKLEVTWQYTYKINKNNAFATRLDAGAIVPLDKVSEVPYERGFYMGTSNSMRGWGYRGLGPGSYEHGRDSLFTGDIKLEWNLEYRGTLYRTFKYGLFADVGNIWLARKHEGMEGAEFDLTRFYKELAIDVGVGIRLDFDFFVIRVDYAVPIYDPTRRVQGEWINKNWVSGSRVFKWSSGLKVAIGYAF